MCFIDFPMHASRAREQQKCILDIRNSGPLQCYSKADLCEVEIDRFILLKLRKYLIGMRIIMAVHPVGE